MEENNKFLKKLSNTQEHFLKKILLEKRLQEELALLNRPDCLRLFGYPFVVGEDSGIKEEEKDGKLFPLLKFFFDNYVATFPFITHNDQKHQLLFWQDTVQPFIESVNNKHLSSANNRRENVTKRKQINRKILNGLLLFYNSMIVTDKDMKYLTDEDHLLPGDVGKLDTLRGFDSPIIEDFTDNDDLDTNIKFKHNMNLNLIGVQKVNETSSNWFNTDLFQSQHHYEFIIQVTIKGHGHANGFGHVNGNTRFYISRAYHNFKDLEKNLKKLFPGIMNIEIGKLPEKFKHDTNKLIKEKLRLSLRGYLKKLCQYEEIVTSQDFKMFINKDKFFELTKEQTLDYKNRLKHEKVLLNTQVEFQRELSKLMIDFSQRFEDFKVQLIQQTDTLSKIFYEIGAKEDLTDLSPLLKVFIQWCKIELTSTIFQIFLTQDNSNEMLNNFKKLHKIFPYGLVYNILRVTNPVAIISKIIGLLLMDIPGSKNKNFLSMMFSMILDDDLNGYDKEIDEIKKKLKSYPNFVEKIESYIDKGLVNENQSMDANIYEVLESVTSHTKFESNPIQEIVDDKGLYNDLKQLYQLKLRQNDKLILKSLWQEPELTRLIRNFLVIFYQPLIELLSRSKMHVFFKGLQHFNEELVQLLTKLNEEDSYYLSSIEIFNKLMQLVDKHIIVFWQFVHNLYNNDREKLFIRLIHWIEQFLIKLRTKYDDIDKCKIYLQSEQIVNEDMFFKQLDERINMIVLKRKFFRDNYGKKKHDKTEDTTKDNNDIINDTWDKLHNNFDYDDNFGLNIDDLQEFNNDINADVELKTKFDQLHELKYDTSELDKFDSYLIKELNRILK